MNTSTRRIRLLDTHLVNQIAAGEVIERPASVVKELIENSIDAGACTITVTVMGGGIDSITVSDDGRGIAGDELALAFQRHATSKLATSEELSTIASLGFRGEALPAIAAVAHVTLTTATSGAKSGHTITVENGNEGTVVPIARPTGTTVSVTQLFANVPARRKFLKAPATEFRHVEKAVRTVALCRPETAFVLIHNGRTVYRLPAAHDEHGMLLRVRTVLGESFVENALLVDSTRGAVRIHGVIGHPTFHRLHADMQYLGVNGRAVRDRTLAHAVKSGYADVLYHGRHPAYVLSVTCLPSTVDVNVHPAKHEIRLLDGRNVHDCIRHIVSDAVSVPLAKTHIQSQPQSGMPHKTAEKNMPHTEGRLFAATEHLKHEMPVFSHNGATQTQCAAIMTAVSAEQQKTDTDDTPPVLGYARALIGGAFIIAESDRGMVIVDMHAAHERILYERLKTAYDARTMKSQSLLLPVAVTVCPEEQHIIETQHAHLLELGFIVTMGGERSAILRSVPFLLRDHDPVQLVRDVLSELIAQDTDAHTAQQTNAVLSKMACYGALRLHDTPTMCELDSLLRAMEQCARSDQCNHGRPVWRLIPFSELDGFFHRGR